MTLKETFVWNFRVFCALVQRDLFVFYNDDMKRRIINTALWTGLVTYVFEYIGFGSVAGLGLFIACGQIATQGFHKMYGLLLVFLLDSEGPRRISYYLTLPTKAWLVFLSYAVSGSVRMMAQIAPIVVVAKLLLANRFDLSSVAWTKFLVVFICIHLLYASLYLLWASYLRSIEELGKKWTLIAETVFLSGGFYFSWQRLYSFSHAFAYLNLCNPLTYANEAVRAAVLGQEGYLPFWWCCFALLAFAAAALLIALRRLIKKLDCVA